ncbi:restriction endonuclease subunit S [Psychrobacter glaciei]|uniref:restriction endonuclease subunit S n=1 Tax=Psychrobacter glaciei TaxID=619771 RepID=UPI003F47C5CF
MHDLKGWVYEKLGDLPILFIDSDRSKRYPKRSEFQDQGIAFLNAESISSGRFDRTKVNHIPYEKYEEIKKGRVENGDIVLTMRGNGVGDAALIFGEGILGLINAQMLILRPNDETINSKFLYYGFISPQFKCELSNFVSGSAQPQLTMTHLRHVPFRVPPLAEQKAIAHILGSLDDKIELNRQMNETLEAMAQALFKSWFVDFDPVIDNALAAGNAIPDEFAERAEQRKGLEKKDNSDIQDLFPDEFEFTEEMGWIPKGWEVSNVGTEFNTVGGGTPSTKNSDFWENGDISWTTPKDLSGNQSKILLNTDRKITELGLNKISSGLLPIDTVLMSSRAPVGYLALAKVPVAINQGYIALKCEKILTPEFAIQWADSAMDEIKQRAGGTTFAEISKTNFRGIPILVPSQKIIDAYSRDVKDLYNQITSRIENINTLAKLRDTLLPKLMSGELRISDDIL